MKLFWLISILLLYSCASHAQLQKYESIDKYALSVGYLPLDMLASKLTAPFKTEDQKVRSIFRWITGHIAYDIDQYHNLGLPPSHVDSSDEQHDLWLLNYYAEKTLASKKGICNDYASLFKVLCNKAGIECKIILGDVREHKGGSVFDLGHAWNAVKIEGKWKLIDVTWCSGYADENVTIFTKHFTERYYCIAPERMIIDHFPNNSKWQLCSKYISKEEFKKGVFFYDLPSFFNIKYITPNSKILDANLKDTLILKLVLLDSTVKVKLGIGDGDFMHILENEETKAVAYKTDTAHYSKKFKKSVDDIFAYIDTIPSDTTDIFTLNNNISGNGLPHAVFSISPNRKGVTIKLLFSSNKYNDLYIIVNDEYFAYYRISFIE